MAILLRVFLSRASQPLDLQSLWAPCPPGHGLLAPRVWEAGWARAGPVGADLGSPKLVDTIVGSRKGLQHAPSGVHHIGGRSSTWRTGPSLLGDYSSSGTLAGASPRRHYPGLHSPEGHAQFPNAPSRVPSDSVLAPPPAHGPVILAYLTTPTPIPAPPHVPGRPGRFWPRLKTQGPPLRPGPASTSEAPLPRWRLHPHALSPSRRFGSLLHSRPGSHTLGPAPRPRPLPHALDLDHVP